MYSLVLLAAMTAGPATAPDWCHGGHACYGCYGGYGCYGCCGCWGGYGYGCCGCWGGSGYGYGCCGCWGGYGYGYYDCYGCHGCYGCYGGCTGSWGCAGCYGSGGGYPPAYYTPPVVMTPGAGIPTSPPAGPTETPPPVKGGEKKNDEVSLGRAKLIVEIPADAKLYIDDQLMKTTTPRRVFSTPPLDVGQTYYYMVRVEVVRDGKVQSDTKRVIVRAGELVTADFSKMDATVTVTADAGVGR